MLEKLISSSPAPKADPRAMLRANDRSAIGGIADDQREEGTGSFGHVLADDVAARRLAERPERPRHEPRAQAAQSNGQPKRNTGLVNKQNTGEEPACVMSDDPEAPATKHGGTSDVSGDTAPVCKMPVDGKANSDLVICVGMPSPEMPAEGAVEAALVAVDPGCILPEDPSLVAGDVSPMDPSLLEAVKTDLPIVSLPVDVVTDKPVVSLPDTPVVETENKPASEMPMIALAPTQVVAPNATVPMVAITTDAESEPSATAVSLEGARKLTLPQGADVSPLDPALAEAVSRQPGGAKTSVPLVPLAGSEAAAVGKASESKGFAHNAEAVSGPASSFAELVRDFAPHQGLGSVRAADPLTALEKPGMIAMAGQDVGRPTPLQMLPIEMGMQAMRGNTRFQIRLDPPELGRVDVRLEISSSGEVKASMVVDRVETLAMLRRDSHSLQYAFEQAGLKQAPDGLSFSLRGDGQNGQQAQDRRENQGRSGSGESELALLETQAAEKAMRRVSIPLSRIDLVI